MHVMDYRQLQSIKRMVFLKFYRKETTMEFTNYNNIKYQEQLELRYNLFLANRIHNIIIALIIAAVLTIDWLRVING